MTQKTIALSSGEAELAGIVKGAAEGLGLVAVARDLGLDASLKLLADSSAAIGICRRTGIGRVRHLATGQLWVQERVRSGDFELCKHPGADNPADIFTKPVHGVLLDRHMASLGLQWEAGRAASASALDGFSWGSAQLPAPARRQKQPRDTGGRGPELEARGAAQGGELLCLEAFVPSLECPLLTDAAEFDSDKVEVVIHCTREARSRWASRTSPLFV